MRIAFLLVTNLLICLSGIAQVHLDFGVQKNFLQNSAEFNDISSINFHSCFAGTIDAKIPFYFGLNLDYFTANDKLIETNTYKRYLVGGTIGIRPFAKKWINRAQPIIETNLNIGFFDKNTTVQSIFNYGAGLELYFTKKSAITITYYSEHYWFITETLINSSVKLGLRMSIIAD
jgi:hypothetical protein